MTRSHHHSLLIPLPDLIAEMMKTQGFQGRMVEFSLQQQWCAIVGPHIAGHTYPEAIRHHKLFLLAENSVWLQQLLFLKSELLARITDVMGEDVLTDIVLRVGLIPAAVSQSLDGDREPDTTDHSSVPCDVSASIEESIQGIQDQILLDRLRMLFLKSAGAHISSPRVSSQKVF